MNIHFNIIEIICFNLHRHLQPHIPNSHYSHKRSIDDKTIIKMKRMEFECVKANQLHKKTIIPFHSKVYFEVSHIYK